MSIELKQVVEQSLDLSTPTLREMVTRHAAVIDSRATLEDMPEALAFQIDMARALLREFTAIHQAEAQQPATGKPVNLQHMAVAENGALRWMTGRKVQNCELYAMPDFGRAPTLYTTPPASQEQADAATSAGTQAAIGHLSRLVDEATSLISQLRTMVDDMHEQWSIGGVPERGEFPLLDRVDDWLSARPSQEQAQQTKCACGDRPVDQCDEEWGPNCDLGNNEKYVRVAHQPSVTVRYDLSPAMVEGAIRDRLIAMGWTPPLQQPKPQPMTDDEIEIAYQHTASKQSFMSFRHGIRSAEAHHGITAQAKKESAA